MVGWGGGIYTGKWKEMRMERACGWVGGGSEGGMEGEGEKEGKVLICLSFSQR